MIWLGVDVGLTGALALVDDTGFVLAIEDMPTFTVKVNKKNRNIIDIHALARVVKNFHPDMAVVEDVSASPQMGVSSAFSFGFSSGSAQMAVASNGVSMILVRPNIWTKQMGVDAKADDSSRRIASQMYPNQADMWPNKGHHGRTDAVLIATYGIRHASTQRN